MIEPRCFFIGTSWSNHTPANYYKALGRELAARGHRVVFLVGERRTAIEDHAANPAIHIWPSPRPTRPADFRFLRGLIERYRPDGLIASFGAVNVMMLAGWLSRVPVRVAWYCTMADAIDAEAELAPWQIALLRRRKRLAYRAASHIAAITDATSRDVQAVFGVPAGKVSVWRRLLVDPRQRLPVDRPRREQTITCAGRLIHIKGQDVLLRALPALAARFPRLCVEFLGDGDQRAAYERLAAQLGVADYVHFAGNVENGEVLARMATSALVVVPSRFDALGTVNLESLAVGTPVVASDTGGIGEIVRDGVDGFLVPPDSPDALADRIGRLLADPAERAALGANARQGFIERFDMAANVARHAQWYEELAASRPHERS